MVVLLCIVRVLSVNLWPLAALCPVSRVLTLVRLTSPIEESVPTTAYAKPPLTLSLIMTSELLKRFRVRLVNLVLFLLLQLRHVAMSRNRRLELLGVVTMSPYSLPVMRPIMLVW